MLWPYCCKLCLLLKGNELSTLPLNSGAKNFQKVDLHKLRNEKRDGQSWSVVTKETKELVHLNENAGCSSSHASYSRENKCYKGTVSFLGGCWTLMYLFYITPEFHNYHAGGKIKAKPKFSFRFQSSKEDSFGPFITKDKSGRSSKVDKVPEGLEAIEHKTMEDPIAEFVEDFQGEKLKETEIHVVQGDLTLGRGCNEHSVAELLNDLQEKNGLLGGKSKMVYFLLWPTGFWFYSSLVQI